MQRKENKRQKKKRGKGRKKGSRGNPKSERGNTRVERKRRDLGELKLNVEVEDGVFLSKDPQVGLFDDDLIGELNDVKIDEGGLVDESDVPKIRKRRYNLEG